MRRLVAFAAGIGLVVAIRTVTPATSAEPLPGASQVQAELAALAADPPPAQASAFDDGRIDVGEYRRAVLARIACTTREAGRPVEVIGPHEVASGRLLTWRYRMSGHRDDAVAAADRRCGGRHSVVTERAWRLSVLPQGRARDTEVSDLRSCLERHGVGVGRRDLQAVLEAAATAAVPVADCVDAHAVLFNL